MPVKARHASAAAFTAAFASVLGEPESEMNTWNTMESELRSVCSEEAGHLISKVEMKNLHISLKCSSSTDIRPVGRAARRIGNQLYDESRQSKPLKVV